MAHGTLGCVVAAHNYLIIQVPSRNLENSCLISYAFITKRVLHSRRYFFTSSTIPFMLLAKKARWLYWHEEGNIPKNGILQKQESLIPQILLPGSSLEKILLLKSCIMFLSSTSCWVFFTPSQEQHGENCL